MAIGFPAGITQAYVVNNAQAKLSALRHALADCENFYQWLAAYSATDLEAAPISMDATSAQAILNAFADAHELNVLYGGGGLGTYTLPYNFAASQRVVIGPLS